MAWEGIDRGVDLAVLVNGFPRLSETFVLQELLELESRGIRLVLFALALPGEVVRQEDLTRLRAPVWHVPDKIECSGRRLARARLTLAAARGWRYPVARARLASAPDRTPAGLDRATVLAAQLVRLGSPPLYIHFAHKPGTIGRFAAHLAGVRYALSCHAKDIWLTPPDELKRKLAGAEVVMTCTAAGRDELARHAGDATPVRLVYHGTNVEEVVPPSEPQDPPQLLSVGRLVEKKGHDTLIRAAGLLRDRDVRFSLRIAGEGVEWPALQRLVHELDLAAHVTFLGPLTPGELRHEYARATAFALACRRLQSGDRDGLPNVVMEAMVHGLPIISTDQAGIAEAIDHDRSGLLVSPEDPSALADALELVLRDPELARRLGAGARASVRERFDRRRLLPAVAATLTAAGLIQPRKPIALPSEPRLAEREAA